MKFFWCLLLLGIAVGTIAEGSLKPAILDLYRSATRDEKNALTNTLLKLAESKDEDVKNELNAALAVVYGGKDKFERRFSWKDVKDVGRGMYNSVINGAPKVLDAVGRAAQVAQQWKNVFN